MKIKYFLLIIFLYSISIQAKEPMERLTYLQISLANLDEYLLNLKKMIDYNGSHKDVEYLQLKCNAILIAEKSNRLRKQYPEYTLQSPSQLRLQLSMIESIEENKKDLELISFPCK